MSFGAEIKDFVSGFKAVRDIQSQQKLDEYRQRQMDKDFPEKGRLDEKEIRDGVKAKPWNAREWLGDLFGDKAAPKSPVGSPVGAAQTQQALPLAAYQNANTGSTPYAPPDDGGFYDVNTNEWSPSYADGGIVDDEEPTLAAPLQAPTPAPAPVQQALPVPQQGAPQMEAPAPQAAVMAPPQEEKRSGLSAALHDGLMAIKNEFGLGERGTAVGPDPAQQRGHEAMASGAGRVSDEDYEAAAMKIDPKGKLGDAKRHLEVMKEGYDFYLLQGEPEKASKYAASIIQYATTKAADYGKSALVALKKGDIQGAVDNMVSGYNNIPNGNHAEAAQVGQDGTVKVKQVDTETGETVEEHTLTGEQLYQAAIGLANKSASWQAIMDAATLPHGIPERPPSEAFNGAMMKLGGANPDGSLINPSAGPSAGPSAVPSAGGGSPAPGPSASSIPSPSLQVSGADILGIPPYMQNYARMMSQRESSNNPNARNGDSVGLFQIQSPAWRDATGHDPVVNGVDERTDPAKNAAVFRKLTAANEAIFKKKFNRDPSPGELAVLHQQGASGGSALLAAAQANPQTPAQQVLTSIGVKNPAAHLASNRIPPNATAEQVVQTIQKYYLAGNQAAGRPQAPHPMAPHPMAPRDTLPEDQVAKPVLPDMPAEPTLPPVLRVDPTDMKGMSAKERLEYRKAVAATNLDNQKKFQNQHKTFQDEMSKYRAAVAAAKQGPKGADPMKLPVKDRSDALAALQVAREAIEGDEDSALADFLPKTKSALNNVAYGLYTHNDLTPDDAYKAAMSMMRVDPKNPEQINFASYKMPNGDVRVKFRANNTSVVIPRNFYEEMASARGNEHHFVRTTLEKQARSDAAWDETWDKGRKFLKNNGRDMSDRIRAGMKDQPNTGFIPQE